MEDRVPLRSLALGELKYRFEDVGGTVPTKRGVLYVSENNAGLQVEIWQESDVTDPDQPRRKVEPCGVFKCNSINAVDLKLTSKFAGDLDSMCVKLIVETESPVQLMDTSDASPPSDVGCLVKATCDVAHLAQIRDMLRNVRYTKFKSSLGGDVSSLDKQAETVQTVSWREGLPGWVSILPYWMYSHNVRIGIERLILLYTIFSVAWAVWQLYIHVALIKAALEPIVVLLDMYLESVMKFIDQILHRWTDLWLYYCQPLVVIWASFIGPVWKAFRLVSAPVLRATKPIIVNIQKLPWKNVTQMWAPMRRFLGVLLIPLTKILAVLRRFQVSVTGFDPGVMRLRMARQLLLAGIRTVGLGTSRLAGKAYRKKQYETQLQKNISQAETDDEPDIED